MLTKILKRHKWVDGKLQSYETTFVALDMDAMQPRPLTHARQLYARWATIKRGLELAGVTDDDRVVFGVSLALWSRSFAVTFEMFDGQRYANVEEGQGALDEVEIKRRSL